ncbi:ABC transporter permease subunit [Plantactinospora sp. S1510]|uniref:ABC transporter permease subunit n=1 Tax=Plantactinospora alkalitolerans TaxID=2789879 RepID=A0ABS0HAZ6_9ACTN|nr:ABC transporter permease subunit [Plantactinospora alkalitolerans]MBF9135466.1 ABC transporter permease subunit [Plantactinospora alkalitolerans]
MTWLTWRQFRGQFLVGLAVLAVVAAFLLYLGFRMRHVYDTDVAGCVAADGCDVTLARNTFANEYGELVTMPAILLMVLPLLVGLFWGTPLVTREFENHTHRLVWNQSVTRRRWLAVKLAMVGSAAVLVTGAVSGLLTWAASRYDAVLGSRFGELSFATRNIVPLGYAAFAFALAVTIGLVVRRTVRAMAVTLLAVAVLQILIPGLARGHVLPPVTRSVAYDAGVPDNGGRLAIRREGPVLVTGYVIPGALKLSTNEKLLTATGGETDTATIRPCLGATSSVQREADPNGGQDPIEACVAGLNLHFDVTYQPADRYWSFQRLEFGGFLVLAGLSCAVALWRVRRLTG